MHTINIKNVTLVIAGSLGFSQISISEEQEISFYGSLRPMVEFAEHDNGDNVKDALSRIGVQGARKIDDQFTAFAKYELPVDVPNGQLGAVTEGGEDVRQSYVGLSGDFGSIQVGRFWSAIYNSIGYASDQLWWNSAPVYYTLDGVDLRIGGAVMYTSPEVNGVKFSAVHSNEIEQSQFSVTFNATEKLRFDVAYAEGRDDDLLGLAAYYTSDNYFINGTYMDREDAGKGTDLVGGIYQGKNTYRLGFSSFQDDADANDDFDAVILGYQYNLVPAVKLWVEVMAWEGSLFGNEDSNQFNVGMNYDF